MRNPFKAQVAALPAIPEKTYADGLLEGRELGMQEMERILCLLREELARVTQARDAQATRADNAADLLLQHIGLRSISLAGIEQDNKRRADHINAVTRLATLPDPTEDLPLDDPRGTFFNKKDEARIVPDYSQLAGADFGDEESTLAGKGN